MVGNVSFAGIFPSRDVWMKNRGRDLQVLPTLVTAGKTSRPDQETIKASDQIKTNFANNNSKICFLMGGDNMFVDVSINVR